MPRKPLKPRKTLQKPSRRRGRPARRRRWQRLALRVPGEGFLLSPKSLALVEEVAAKWAAWDYGPRTILAYTTWLRRLLAWLEAQKIAPDQVKTENLEKWTRRWYRHEPNTKAALRAAVNAFLRAAGELRIMEHPPAPLRRLGARSTRQPDVPEASEMARLLKVSQEQGQNGTVEGMLRWILFMAFVHTGLRASEVASLERRRCRLDSSGRILAIRVKTKWGHDEEVQVNAPLAAALGQWLVLRDRLARNPQERKKARKTQGWAVSDFIFPSRSGQGPLSYVGVYLHIKYLAALAKAKIHPHAIRHYFATTLLNQGVPVHDVQALMRHRNVASLNPYLHSNVERQRNAVEVIGKIL